VYPATTTRARQGRSGLTAVDFSRGVGYLELMLAIALAAILMAIAVPTYYSYLNRSKEQTAIADMQAIEQQLKTYEVLSEQGTLPASLADLGVPIPLDPWGQPYQYLNLDGANRGQMRKDRSLVPINTDYDLYSMGPDGRSVAPLTAAMSRDDIVRAGNGSFIGVASDYVP
jgi:general secretion pathway protein G